MNEQLLQKIKDRVAEEPPHIQEQLQERIELLTGEKTNTAQDLHGAIVREISTSYRKSGELTNKLLAFFEARNPKDIFPTWDDYPKILERILEENQPQIEHAFIGIYQFYQETTTGNKDFRYNFYQKVLKIQPVQRAITILKATEFTSEDLKHQHNHVNPLIITTFLDPKDFKELQIKPSRLIQQYVTHPSPESQKALTLILKAKSPIDFTSIFCELQSHRQYNYAPLIPLICDLNLDLAKALLPWLRNHFFSWPKDTAECCKAIQKEIERQPHLDFQEFNLLIKLITNQPLPTDAVAKTNGFFQVIKKIDWEIKDALNHRPDFIKWVQELNPWPPEAVKEILEDTDFENVFYCRGLHKDIVFAISQLQWPNTFQRLRNLTRYCLQNAISFPQWFRPRKSQILRGIKDLLDQAPKEFTTDTELPKRFPELKHDIQAAQFDRALNYPFFERENRKAIRNHAINLYRQTQTRLKIIDSKSFLTVARQYDFEYYLEPLPAHLFCEQDLYQCKKVEEFDYLLNVIKLPIKDPHQILDHYLARSNYSILQRLVEKYNHLPLTISKVIQRGYGDKDLKVPLIVTMIQKGYIYPLKGESRQESALILAMESADIISALIKTQQIPPNTTYQGVPVINRIHNLEDLTCVIDCGADPFFGQANSFLANERIPTETRLTVLEQFLSKCHSHQTDAETSLQSQLELG